MSASVRSSKDRAKKADGRPIIRVGKGDSWEVNHCSTRLRDPVVTSIDCSEDYAGPARNCSSIGIRPRNPG